MMFTLYRNAVLTATMIALLSCPHLLAQENAASALTANLGLAATQEPLSTSQPQADALTFEEVLKQYNENEVTITRLFSSSPIGFPKRQIEHMAKIDRLKEKNKQLKTQLDAAALLSFQQSANPSPRVCQTVFNIISKKIDISRSGYDFDPEHALEVAKLMLAKMDQAGELSAKIRLEDIAYQGF